MKNTELTVYFRCQVETLIQCVNHSVEQSWMNNVIYLFKFTNLFL